MNTANTGRRSLITTPVQFYTHPEYENQVSLFGMIHIAQPHYYQGIQTWVDWTDKGGAVIHYERVKRATSEELQASPRSVRAKAAHMESFMKSLYGWFDSFGLVKQSEAMTYRPHWENHDASILDLAERIGSSVIRRNLIAVKVIELMFRRTGPDTKQDFLVSALHNILSDDNGHEDTKRRLSGILVGNSDGAVVDYRNDIALTAFDDQQRVAPGSDVTLIWGAGHLPGLGKGLENRGYTKAYEERVVAIDAADIY